ncbi:hypothetical protein HPP92_026912 [Vanilla planifolia]|uniref:Uncharacterized protein n=1 Tax=Vanilla planifolia TaxID=51239 RepID=A0A835PCE5_VANPL|nr:hypothetical protein HPP92_026912 [Vanilla planifolia]
MSPNFDDLMHKHVECDIDDLQEGKVVSLVAIEFGIRQATEVRSKTMFSMAPA